MGLPGGLLPPRPAEAHKGDFGRVLLVAGSRELSGAAALCTLGALRVGAGLVTLALPKCLHAPMVEKLTEAMFKVLPETSAGTVSSRAYAELASTIERMQAVGIGPGLSQHAETKDLCRRLIATVVTPLVVDADALNALAEDVGLFKKRTLPCVITPHPGEMGRLIRQSAQDVQSDRERTARAFAQQHRVVVVLKGHGTVVASFDGQTYINDTGNRGMASGGFGDVLTGMIVGLLGQGLAPFDAAGLGVYLHGLAGDVAADAKGQTGLLASDLIEKIPQAIRQYQGLPVPP